MMKTIVPLKRSAVILHFILGLCLCVSSANSQSFKGKDGAENYSVAGTYILNRYSSLAASVSSGAASLTVSNILELSGSYPLANAVNPYANDAIAQGDLVMILQVQGADITTTDNVDYGTITNYNNTGKYELRTVFNVSGNTIYLCQGLTNSYTQNGRSRAQVIRIPRLSTLTVSSGVTISGLSWSGSTGGVIAVESDGPVIVNGTVSANAIGFRGGVDDITSSISSGSAPLLLYRTTISTTTAGKGEGIAGNASDYTSFLNGAYGRGAPANGGGGGNGHNSGGGGGSNAGTNGILVPWNGTGIKSSATPAWANAWNLESPAFATDISTGAGRGGYSYSNSNQDALTVAPENTLWGGNNRTIVGGFGGRPLDYSGNSRLFMGGGGGAGDGNNSSAGNGGNGAGIIYLFTGGNISGTGSITANGQNGFNTQSSNIDAGGGGGAGGAIVITSPGTITGISLQANGGKGGDQLALTSEAEGPGGGGGGGFIATTSTAISRQVNGGDNGVSYSAQVTEFLPNGATQGAGGTITGAAFSDVVACTSLGFVLPVKLISFTAAIQQSSVMLDWVTTSEVNSDHFDLERSIDGKSFFKIATILTEGNATGKKNYHYADNIMGSNPGEIYYRLKMVDDDNRYAYSDIRVVSPEQQTANKIACFPNPSASQLHIVLPALWQGKYVRFEMYDITGRATRQIERSAAAQTESFNLKGLDAGYYVVRVTMGSETAQLRFIKN